MTGFLPNLPTLYDDETLYSWAGFVHASNSNIDARATSRQIYGVPHAALLHDFPSHLNSLDERLEHSLGPPRALALRHTLLGYFLPTQSHSACTDIIRSVMIGSASHLKFKLGIAASRVGGHHVLKGCIRCFDEQDARRGRAFWRVTHQFPSVFCCNEHGTPLQVAWDQTTPVHRRGWILPRIGLPRQWRHYPKFDGSQFARLRRLANYSARWAELEPGELDASRLAKTYRVALRKRDMVTARGSLRLARLVDFTQKNYHGLDVLDELRVLRNINADWPGLVGSLARSVPRPGHPLKHLLMVSMLFETWGEFMDDYRDSDQSSEAVAPLARTRACDGSDMNRLKLLVLTEGLSVSAAGRQVGVTTSTAVRWAKILGIAYTSRAKVLTPDRLSDIRRLLVEGLPKKVVVEQCGISEVSVSRLLSSEPSLASTWHNARHESARRTNRARFLVATRSLPNGGAKEIRAVSGSGYAWLYRHDRDWLLDHLPSIFNRLG